MKFFDILQTASSSMLRSKARTFLTIIAIFIGAMTITLTNGIGTGIKSYLNRQVGNLGATNVLEIQLTAPSSTGPRSGSDTPATYNPGQKIAISTDQGPRAGQQEVEMTDADVQKIAAIPNVTSAVPERSITPDYISGTGGKYQLLLTQQFGESTADMLAGQGVNNNATNNQVTIPEAFTAPLGYSSNLSIIGQTVQLGITNAAGKQSEVPATVEGVQQKTLIGDSAVTANTALANQLHDVQSVGLPAASADSFDTVEATFPSNFSDAQIATIKQALTTDGYSGQTIKDRENTIFTVINVIIVIFDMFGAIALLAASFGIINTLFMSVQERTKEIGLMKALGMSPRRIFMLFSIEAVLIGFWGSVLGVGFAALIGNAINAIGRRGFLKDFSGLSLLTFPLSTIAVVIVGIMLIAFLAGTLPALRASRKDPIEALRYE